MSMPEFHEVRETLGAVDAEVEASESHGMLCGLLSQAGAVDMAAWIAEVLRNTAPRGEPARQCLAVLTRLHDSTATAIGDANLQFSLLLPGDETDLRERAEALGEWCGGFLYGVGLKESRSDADLPTDVREALNDLAEISRVEIDPDDGEDNEEAYAELVEYVRVAVLMVRDTLNPPPKPAKPDSPDPGGATIH